METRHNLEIFATRQDLEGLETRIERRLTQIELDMAHMKSELLLWMFTGGAGFSALVLGGVYFMLERMLP